MMEKGSYIAAERSRPPTIETSRGQVEGTGHASGGITTAEKERTRNGNLPHSPSASSIEKSGSMNSDSQARSASKQKIERLPQEHGQTDQGLNWQKQVSQKFNNTSSTSGSEAITYASRPNIFESTHSSIDTGNARSLPSLKRRETSLMQKEAHPWEHIGITLGLPMIILFDLIVPCILYYTWYDTQKANWERECADGYPNQKCPIQQPEFDRAILGYAIISFGFGELWILLARVWRLIMHREECAPLLSRNKWELDATCWVYAVAMLMALVPFVVGSTLEIPRLYLYSPSFLMGFLGILMAITLCVPIKIPIGINSHARGSRLRPFIYYAAEDFIAVDGLQDREFRVRYNERYESNKMFRHFFVYLTMWWILGVCIYIGCVSVVIWTLDFHYAFGLSFGVLFSYIAIWAAVSATWTKLEMKREHKAYEEGEIDC
jgi:hypothetical protein